ncbi:ATP synthase subunit g, mitochondrial-like [Rhinolophus ferrumequinum]|uniref:ATP synthase subunit g, mitochondrial-like n=1 Tax=Rhinolophus ferrumequinum TaxID=59479 RepID=UPI00140FB627|nr:ATP synthase subunit g, mitochondrial-like [Rhinolophus ferrumequinum]
MREQSHSTRESRIDLTPKPANHGHFVHNLAEKAPVLANTAVTYSKPQLAIFLPYAKVELLSPTPAKIPTATQNLKKIVSSAQTGSFKQLTGKEALLNGLAATEVWMWFYVGEIIGKGGILVIMFEDQSLTSVSFGFII